MVHPSSEDGKSTFGWEGQEGCLDEVTFHCIYLFNTNLLSACSVLAGPRDSAVTETGPCLDDDKVECGRLHRQALKDGENSDRSGGVGAGPSVHGHRLSDWD